MIPQAVPSRYNTLASINGQAPVCRSSPGAGALGAACNSRPEPGTTGIRRRAAVQGLQASLKCCSASTMPPAHLLEACRQPASPSRHRQTDRTLSVPAGGSRKARRLHHSTLNDQECSKRFSWSTSRSTAKPCVHRAASEHARQSQCSVGMERNRFWQSGQGWRLQAPGGVPV